MSTHDILEEETLSIDNIIPKKVEIFVDGEGWMFLFIDGAFIRRYDCEDDLSYSFIEDLEKSVVRYYRKLLD